MRSATLRFYLGVLATALCGTAAVVACGSDSESAFGGTSIADGGSTSSSGGSSSGSTADSGTADAAFLPANGIVIVHAASFGAFRLCFESQGTRRPIPSADLLPESNLVGVDVGSAVRIDPISGPPGKVLAYAVDDIAQYYLPGEAGPTCAGLGSSLAFQKAHEVGTISDDLSFGVNLLVLSGSVADQNLKLRNIRLSAFVRDQKTLPVQVLPLARNLDTRAGNRKIEVAAGLLDGGADAEAPEIFVQGTLEAGVVVPQMPHELVYNPDPNQEGQFATSGFQVALGASLDGGADAGPRVVILAQSLADIQRMSAPRELPGPWFNARSSYVLLLLGNAEETDANADELERLHFLAVPVASPPTSDAGEPVGDATTD